MTCWFSYESEICDLRFCRLTCHHSSFFHSCELMKSTHLNCPQYQKIQSPQRSSNQWENHLTLDTFEETAVWLKFSVPTSITLGVLNVKWSAKSWEKNDHPAKILFICKLWQLKNHHPSFLHLKGTLHTSHLSRFRITHMGSWIFATPLLPTIFPAISPVMWPVEAHPKASDYTVPAWWATQALSGRRLLSKCCAETGKIRPKCITHIQIRTSSPQDSSLLRLGCKTTTSARVSCLIFRPRNKLLPFHSWPMAQGQPGSRPP